MNEDNYNFQIETTLKQKSRIARDFFMQLVLVIYNLTAPEYFSEVGFSLAARK